MVTELDKYRAQFFQVGGLCFMTPLGKVVLGLLDYDLGRMWLKLLLYSIFSLLLFYVGIIFVVKGEEHLEKEKYR